jgi:hypothetical protein
MAASSRYLKISSSVLMEYIYTDPSSPEIITTTAAPWYKMVDGHDGKEYYYNNDNSKLITGNVRDRAAALIDTTLNKFAYLNIDEIRAYNDVDPLLTDTVDLPVGFTASDPVEYDTVRLHLVQGFNFEENEGFLFETELKRPDDKISKISSLVYLKADNYETLNPSPFLFNGKSYAAYVEIKIPSLRFLIDEYNTEYANSLTPDSDILSFKMSGGVGFRQQDPINFRFGFIDRTERFNGNDFFYITSQNEFALPKEDQYSLLSGVIKPATGADYIEIYGQYDGDIYEDFIQGLNNDGGDYIAYHQIVVSEQVGSVWIETQTLEFQQTSNFEDPLKFRPIIQNNSAVAYRIAYTLRLLNRNDNQTIIKDSSYTSTDTAKYSRKLSKINLGTNPTINKIYNKVYDNVVNFSKRGGSDIPKPDFYKNYITSFQNISNLILNSESVNFDNDGMIQTASQGTQIAYGQGMAELVIAPFDTWLKIVISEKLNDTVVGKDLSGVGELCLNFKNSDSFVICIVEETTNQVNKASGESLFKITTTRSEEIVSLSDKTFYITSKNEDGVETLIYTGSFISASEFSVSSKVKEIERLKRELSILGGDINTLSTYIDAVGTSSDFVINNISKLSLDREIPSNRTQSQTIEAKLQNEVVGGLDSIKSITDTIKEKLKDLNK